MRNHVLYNKIFVHEHTLKYAELAKDMSRERFGKKVKITLNNNYFILALVPVFLEFQLPKWQQFFYIISTPQLKASQQLLLNNPSKGKSSPCWRTLDYSKSERPYQF